MQRCLYNWNSNSDRGNSPRSMCTKIGVATPTPTAIRKRLRVVMMPNVQATCVLGDRPNLRPVIGPYSQFDGYYAANSVRPDHWNTIKLLEYLRLAKELYQLSDTDAIQLLGFFKNNLNEACRHLQLDETRSHMHLDFDSPWRLSAKSISMERFGSHSFLRNVHQLFIVNSSILTNILPQQPLAEQFPGRYLRIQRTFHRGQVIWVGCVLPNNQAPIEVAAVLLPTWLQSELDRCTEFMDELERYLGPLVLASKSWSAHEQKPIHRHALIQVLSKLASTMKDLLENQLASEEVAKEAVAAVVSTYEILY